MNTVLENFYSKEYSKIKNLGYDFIEERKIESNSDTGYHAHPFTACMIIIEGGVVLNNTTEEIILNKGDFIEVKNNISHTEKTGSNGALILYGKKFNENKYNLAIIEDSLNSLYLGDNHKTISFITKTPASHILYLTLYKQHYSEIWNSQEDILNIIPKVYASRSTIINLIQEGIDSGFIHKKKLLLDKRSVYYELDENLFYSIESWLKVRKSEMIEMFKLISC
ncbi:cupin domain-containing protein [Alphaproteobacteria bacterium]|nr:cupin domain-containing protein [Alphaproteobacteria bacterium]